MLREVFRRASLSNPGDAPGLLAHPEALVLPDTEVLAGHSRVAVTPDGTVAGFATVLGPGRSASSRTSSSTPSTRAAASAPSWSRMPRPSPAATARYASR